MARRAKTSSGARTTDRRHKSLSTAVTGNECIAPFTADPYRSKSQKERILRCKAHRGDGGRENSMARLTMAVFHLTLPPGRFLQPIKEVQGKCCFPFIFSCFQIEKCPRKRNVFEGFRVLRCYRRGNGFIMQVPKKTNRRSIVCNQAT